MLIVLIKIIMNYYFQIYTKQLNRLSLSNLCGKKYGYLCFFVSPVNCLQSKAIFNKFYWSFLTSLCCHFIICKMRMLIVFPSFVYHEDICKACRTVPGKYIPVIYNFLLNKLSNKYNDFPKTINPSILI